MAVGNESAELTKAGELEKKKLFEGSSKRDHPSSYINYEIDDEDIKNAEETARGTINVVRSIDKARNSDFKAKKKFKKQ